MATTIPSRLLTGVVLPQINERWILEAPIVILSAIARDTLCGGDLGSSRLDNVVR
jgi:hypothetical protein